MARHAHEDALSDAEFEQLVDGAKLLEPPWNLEALFVVLVAGRLGLRIGEIAHAHRSWLSLEKGMLEIPSQDACRKGEDGGICGYCRRQAHRTAGTSDRDLEDLLATYWEPKTSAAERAVPFEFDERVEHIVRAFFDYYRGAPFSVNTARRRVGQAVEASTLSRRIYPHALRATAASKLAYDGLPVSALQAMLGWSKIETAEKYLRLSGGRTKKALANLHT